MKINKETIFVFNDDGSCTLWNNQDDNINSLNQRKEFRFRGYSTNQLHGADFWNLDESELEWIQANFKFNKELSYE